MLSFAAIGIGPTEIIIVLVIVLLLFGAKRLPEVGRSLGQGMREFKNSVTGKDSDDDERRELEGSKADAAEGRDGARTTESAPAGTVGGDSRT